jgi:5-formyltetrahydrofolate cyclo-ligase
MIPTTRRAEKNLGFFDVLSILVAVLLPASVLLFFLCNARPKFRFSTFADLFSHDRFEACAPPSMNSPQDVRSRIWKDLAKVALPDSRFHLNFAEVIPDFVGSHAATNAIVNLPAYQKCRYAFVTPDNCLVELRRRMLEAGITLIVSTYGIYRGFVLLERANVPQGFELYAAWLDGLEHFGRSTTLAELRQHGRFDLMVTGASAVSLNGVRFGKGHGFFDLEWGMFTELGLADECTPVVAVVHDVQVVPEKLLPSPTDILVDWIATPTRIIEVQERGPRPRGIKWELLTPAQIQATPPLQELWSRRPEARS